MREKQRSKKHRFTKYFFLLKLSRVRNLKNSYGCTTCHLPLWIDPSRSLYTCIHSHNEHIHSLRTTHFRLRAIAVSHAHTHTNIHNLLAAHVSASYGQRHFVFRMASFQEQQQTETPRQFKKYAQCNQSVASVRISYRSTDSSLYGAV